MSACGAIEVGQLDARKTRGAEPLERDALPEDLLAGELEAHMGRLDLELDSRLANAREKQHADGKERCAEQRSDVREADRPTASGFDCSSRSRDRRSSSWISSGATHPERNADSVIAVDRSWTRRRSSAVP